MGRNSGALLARAVNVAFAPKYSQKSPAVSETIPDFSLHPPPPQGFSPYVSTICSAQVTRHLCEDALVIALAGSLAPELAIEQRLGTDREDDAHYLHAHREAERVELSNRPRQDLVGAVERHPKQMLDLLCRRPMPPRAREIGMYGKAITPPSSARMPALRCRLSGEPAIGSRM
jgi:hypothetical protein